MRAHRRSKLNSSTHSQPLHQMQVKGQHRDSSALQTRKYRSTHSVGGWVDPRAGLDGLEERKKYYSHRNSNPDRPDAVATTLRRLSVSDNHVSTKGRAVYF